MKLDAHRRLSDIHEAQGKGYGKLVQKLLALAFLEAGTKRVTERSIQGIDLELTFSDGRRIAMEVKTSEPGTEGRVVFGGKDLKGLAAREEEGFEPYVAVLGPHLLDEWVFARHVPGEIQANTALSPTRLRPYRDPRLEAIVRETFPAAVGQHAALAARDGQRGLDRILHDHPGYRIA